MRFHFGAFPEDQSFNPEAEGWVALREGNLGAVHLMALPASVGLFLLWLLLAFFTFPADLLTPKATQLSDTVVRIQFPVYETATWPLLAVLGAILILFIPVHELLHAICCPGWGLSSKTVFGAWPSRGFFYIHHDGPMRRNRFLLVLGAPYLALSLLPLALMAILRVTGWTAEVMISLAWLSLLGSLFAGGDLVSAGSLLAQIPSTAMVRNKGRISYWKPADPAS